MDHDHSAEVRKIVLSVVEDCSQCHQPYSLDDLRIVGRNGNLWVLAVRCTECQQQAFVAAVVGDYDDDSSVAATAFDLIEEAEREEDELAGEPVDVDDVLDMHRYLETFDGDFRKLFKRQQRSE